MFALVLIYGPGIIAMFKTAGIVGWEKLADMLGPTSKDYTGTLTITKDTDCVKLYPDNYWAQYFCKKARAAAEK